MNRAIPLLLLALSLTSCGNQGRRIELGGNSYFFPDHHISAIVDPEDSGDGEYYIRLIPGGSYFWLVYDPGRESRPDSQGRDIPTIAHINDYPGEITVTDTAAGKVVCAKTPVNDESAVMRQIFSCGFRIYDNGVAWSVIIPGDLAASAPAIKRRAELTLADYRRDHWVG